MRARCWGCRSDGQQTEVAAIVVQKGLSVRDTERLVRRMIEPPSRPQSDGDGDRSEYSATRG